MVTGFIFDPVERPSFDNFCQIEAYRGISTVRWQEKDFMSWRDIKVLPDLTLGFKVDLLIVLRSVRQLGVAEARVVEIPKVTLDLGKEACVEDSEGGREHLSGQPGYNYVKVEHSLGSIK